MLVGLIISGLDAFSLLLFFGLEGFWCLENSWMVTYVQW